MAWHLLPRLVDLGPTLGPCSLGTYSIGPQPSTQSVLAGGRVMQRRDLQRAGDSDSDRLTEVAAGGETGGGAVRLGTIAALGWVPSRHAGRKTDSLSALSSICREADGIMASDRASIGPASSPLESSRQPGAWMHRQPAAVSFRLWV